MIHWMFGDNANLTTWSEKQRTNRTHLHHLKKELKNK